MNHMTVDAKPPLNTMWDWLRVTLCGICMGAADILPGISGGTMAFIMGFYEDLLTSIKSLNGRSFMLLLTFQFRQFFRVVGWEFLLALVTGIAISFITLSHIVDYLLGHEVYRVYLYAGFLGLIAASVVFCAKLIEVWKWRHFAALAAGAAIAFTLTDGFLQGPVNEPLYNVSIGHTLDAPKVPLQNYNTTTKMLMNVPETTLSAMLAKEVITSGTPVYSHQQQKMAVAGDYVDGHFHRGIDWWIVCCGAIAISAMLLPGISGSYLLTILGMYPVVIGALADFIHGVKHSYVDSEALLILVSMMMGIVAGALVFSHVVSWLLTRYHNMTVAALTGFMIGAFRSVWPFWSYEYVLNPLKLAKGPLLQPVAMLLPDVDAPLFWIATGFAVAGFALVFVIEYAAKKKKGTEGT